MMRFLSRRHPDVLGPDFHQIDLVQKLSCKGLPRHEIAQHMGIDDRLLDRWADACLEIRDALSVNDAIHHCLTTGLDEPSRDSLHMPAGSWRVPDVRRHRR